MHRTLRLLVVPALLLGSAGLCAAQDANLARNLGILDDPPSIDAFTRASHAIASASLQLGMDAYVDIEDFSASGAGLGLVFLHRPDDRLLPSPHHLRLGEIEATLAAVEPPEVPIDLERLLDQVRVRAPKVLGR